MGNEQPQSLEKEGAVAKNTTANQVNALGSAQSSSNPNGDQYIN